MITLATVLLFAAPSYTPQELEMYMRSVTHPALIATCKSVDSPQADEYQAALDAWQARHQDAIKTVAAKFQAIAKAEGADPVDEVRGKLVSAIRKSPPEQQRSVCERMRKDLQQDRL